MRPLSSWGQCPLVPAGLGFLSNLAESLLGFRAQSAIGAKPAMEARLCIESSRRDLPGNLFHFQPSFFQLSFAAAGGHAGILRQVVEHKMLHLVSPLLARRQGVDGKLQAVVRILLCLRLARLVVSDDNFAARKFIDAVDSSGNANIADLHLEGFFRVQYFRYWSATTSREERFQLFDPLALVQIVLIPVLNFRFGKFRPEL